jgi:hypothetical protein
MAFCITNINTITVIDDAQTGSCLTTASNNIKIIRGSSFNLIFDLDLNTTASDGTVTSSDADLTGHTVNASIQNSSTSNTDLLFMSTQNRMVDITNESRVILSIPVKHSSRLPIGTKYYCVRLINSNGDTQKILQGIATIADS